MKRMLTFLLLYIPFLLSAQSSLTEPKDYDQRLLTLWSEDYIQSLQEKNPMLHQRNTYFLDHGYELRSKLPGKEEYIQSISVPDMNNINILQLIEDNNLIRKWDKPVLLNIQGTDKMLVLFAEKKFAQDFKAFYNKTN